MQQKVILVLVDGLSYQAAVSRMGYMQHLVENKIAGLYQVQAELPTNSRPLYETILTGTKAYQNGITHNHIIRRSREKSLFELARMQNLTTAAAAYHWVSELYNRAPFDPYRDREQADPDANIQYGKFYFHGDYPDSHLFIDGELLRRKYDPDFLLIHPMGVDEVGHAHGGESPEYQAKAQGIDGLLAVILPTWIELGYQVIVTADHGMNVNGTHGGLDPAERVVPLWTIGNCFRPVAEIKEIPQLGIAPGICQILNIQSSDRMIEFGFPGFVKANLAQG